MNLSIAILLVLLFVLATSSASEDADISALLRGDTLPSDFICLESLGLSTVMQPYRVAHARRSLKENSITINGVVNPHGVGTHARSEMVVELGSALTAGTPPETSPTVGPVSPV